MNATESAHHQGERVCRPTEWTDVAKFFLFNYVLHAVTVLTEPGSTIGMSIMVSFTAVLLPFSGVMRAGSVIYRRAFRGETNLHIALRSHALCMLVPESFSPDNGIRVEHISDETTQVHGEFPPTLNPPSDSSFNLLKEILAGPLDLDPFGALALLFGYPEGPPSAKYRMICVPTSFEAYPLVGPSNPKSIYKSIKHWFDIKRKKISPDPLVHYTDPIIASNFNLIQCIAAIIQVVYGSFELYLAEKDQLQRYGYASYQLTVIPYVLMSFTNLIAGLTGPRYPTRYLVHYRGLRRPGTEREILDPESTPASLLEVYPEGWWGESERLQVEEQIGGAVGLVYGHFPDPVPIDTENIVEHLTDRLLHMARSFNYPTRVLDCMGPSLLSSISKNLSYLYPNGTRRNYQMYPTLSPYQAAAASVFVATPYIIIYALTKFEPGNSTISQRAWVMAWLVFGQYCGMAHPIFFSRFLSPGIVLMILAAAIYGVASFGGFVVVAQMMSHSETCQRL